MTNNDPGSSGHCRCGRVQFAVHTVPLVTMACHCNGCQRMTASAYSLSALYASDAFELTAGDPVIGGMHGPTRHYFCPYCMSWLFTRPDGMDGLVNVRTTMLDNAAALAPFIESCTDEKLPWATTNAEYSFEKFPPPEQYPALLAAYAQSRQA